MPARPQTDIVREHGERLNTLVEQVGHLRLDHDRVEGHLLRIETGTSETRRYFHELDKIHTVTAHDIERLEKKVDELLARRWELWKLAIAAFLGSTFTLGAGFVSKWIDRPVETKSVRDQR